MIWNNLLFNVYPEFYIQTERYRRCSAIYCCVYCPRIISINNFASPRYNHNVALRLLWCMFLDILLSMMTGIPHVRCLQIWWSFHCTHRHMFYYMTVCISIRGHPKLQYIIVTITIRRSKTFLYSVSTNPRDAKAK